MTSLRAQYGGQFENQIYEYSSSYYSMELYKTAYCEHINSVPLKILGFILQRLWREKYLLHMLTQENQEECK